MCGVDKLRRPEATAEIQTAKNILFQIVALFADTEKISKSRKNMKFGGDLATDSANDMEACVIALP
jgi:hypothetical protein